MSREVRRVPDGFDWPLKKVWAGFLMPDSLHEAKCLDCDGRGYSPQAARLHDLWYGYVPFNPEDRGSTPLTHDTPAVRAFAVRNVSNAPDFYGIGESAVRREATRLAALWNGMWCHHLNQDDVNALVASGRLMDFTHTWSREDRWQPIDPLVIPTAAQVNEWSLSGMGHDSINASIVVQSRCEAEGFPSACATCGGHGTVEKYLGQRQESAAWEPAEPPVGDGWQLWETTTEGSPISPPLPTAEALAGWMVQGGHAKEYDTALRFIHEGWAPTFVSSTEHGLQSGVDWVGTRADA